MARYRLNSGTHRLEDGTKLEPGDEVEFSEEHRAQFGQEQFTRVDDETESSDEVESEAAEDTPGSETVDTIDTGRGARTTQHDGTQDANVETEDDVPEAQDEETESSSDTDAEPQSDAESDTQSDTDVEPQSDAVRDSDADTDVQSEPQSDVQSEDAATETQSDTSSDDELPDDYSVLRRMAVFYDGDEVKGNSSESDIREHFSNNVDDEEVAALEEQARDDLEESDNTEAE